MNTISSAQNPRVKLVRQLQSRGKVRRNEKKIVLEGVRLINDALDAHIPAEFVFYTEGVREDNDAVDRLLTRLENADALCLPVIAPLMQEMSDTETPQGVLAVFPWPEIRVPDVPDLVIVADGWRDPGNLGTMLRTAAAAGVGVVALMPGTVDATNPKTLRAGMGAQFRVATWNMTWEHLQTRFPDHAIYLADMGGDTPYDAVDWTQPSLIVVGEEAHGLSKHTRALPTTTTIHVPMASGAESLNAAVTASILIYAARRHAL
jgi:RNA methyltransferase, TrmH family